MTISAVYDFASIRQRHDELVERKQAAVVGTAKPTESTFGWPVMGQQQVLLPPPPPKPIDSVYGWRVLNNEIVGASRSRLVVYRNGTTRLVTEVWDGMHWWLRNPNPSNSD